MSKFKVGDRVRATRASTRWVRMGDSGTVAIACVDGSICVLWDNPGVPHVDDEGWWVDGDKCDLETRLPSFLRRLFGAKAAA